MGVYPPPLPAWANFTRMMECKPESSRCNSVYSVVYTVRSGSASMRGPGGRGAGAYFRARIFKRLWSPGIDSKEWIPPAYVAWRAGTITLFLLGA